MSDQEAIRGPYLLWIRDARSRVGERVWEHLADLPCEHADTLLRSMGVIAYEHSHHLWEHVQRLFDPRVGVDVQTETIRDSIEDRPGPKPIFKSPGSRYQGGLIEE